MSREVALERRKRRCKMSVTRLDENLAYHAGRILLLIRRCGSPKKPVPAIKGRTRLAKLDFFLRYPKYLERAGQVLGQSLSLDDLGLADTGESATIESRMIRYRFGPWDEVYYPTLAYLIGKGLVRVDASTRTESFTLTNAGMAVADDLVADSSFSDLRGRADTIYRLFHKYTGTKLKEFIYVHFPEVVEQEMKESL